MSVTNEELFRLKNGVQNGIVYDKFLLNIGNSDFRFKQSNNSFFSNLGEAKGFFDSRGLSVSCLLGPEESKEAPIKSYEFY